MGIVINQFHVGFVGGHWKTLNKSVSQAVCTAV